MGVYVCNECGCVRTGEEDENVSRRLSEMDLHDSNESSIQVVCLRLLGIENVHWMCAAWDGENGLGGEMGGRGYIGG